MGLEVMIEVFHKERIKPSSPTPHHLKNFSLSMLDQFSPAVHVPLILFYPNNSDIHKVNNIDPQSLVVERTKRLKTSLSETLTRFYPFAGRINGHFSAVCCNDEGAMFLEAQVNCPLSWALEKPDLGFLKELVPNLQSAEENAGQDLLLVQANFFECGGVAIGFKFSHKIIDAFTISTFLNSWSSTSRGLQLPPHQHVSAASRFPPLELFEPPPQLLKFVKEKFTTWIFLFESSEIECLKSKAASAAVQNPTRVEVVSALIWKCAMKASTANLGFARPSSSIWLQMVNMRNILAPPSMENIMGNLLGFFQAKWTIGESHEDDDLQGLVAAMRKGYEEFKVKYSANGVGADDLSNLRKEFGEWLRKDDIECYCSNSWCRFPFYETDFGWGKPLMGIPPTDGIKNMTMLKDSSDGRGIEARLTLKEENMAIFEKNEELLAYASLNPSVMLY